MVEIKTSAEVEAMRGPGRVVAQILAAVQDQAKAGMRTAELDEIARDVLAGAGAYSPFLNYQPRFAPVPFPAGICTDFGGHGVGRAMHEDPHIPNEGAPGRGPRLVPGLVIAIEPWFLAGGR